MEPVAFEIDWFKWIQTLGMAAMGWYLLVYYLPNMEKRHKEERDEISVRQSDEREGWKQERLEFLSYIEKRDKEFMSMWNKISEEQVRNNSQIDVMMQKIEHIEDSIKK